MLNAHAIQTTELDWTIPADRQTERIEHPRQIAFGEFVVLPAARTLLFRVRLSSSAVARLIC